MSFSLIFLKKSVPEWKLCYYDYVEISELIALCKKAYAIRCNIEDLTKEDSYSYEENLNFINNKPALEELRNRNLIVIYNMVEKANFLFYKFHSLNKRVIFVFLQFKIHQLNERLKKYSLWEDQVEETQHFLTKLLSNCFAQTLKLEELTKVHIETYSQIYNKHSQSFKNFDLTTPSLKTARLVRSLEDFNRLQKRVDQAIQSHKEIVEKEIQHKLTQQFQPSPFKVSLLSYLFGLLNSFSLCTIIIAIILLGVNLRIGNEQTQDLIKKRIIFANQYKLWKCTGFITLFAWVIAISFYIFERKRINYPLIFQYEYKITKSTRSLTVATLSLLLWSSFFVFYVLDLLGIYKVARVSSNPDHPITIFFPLIIYGFFILTFIIQFIWTRRGTIFLLLSLLKIILSLFGLYQMVFYVIWATQQLLSLLQIYSDFVYTICYYSRMLNTPVSTTNPCFSYGFRIIPECVAIFIYSIRFFQCIKLAVENNKIIGTREMYRLIRILLYICLASLSIAVVDKNSWGVLWVWLGIGVVTTIYSIFIDIVLDWNLFHIIDGKIVRKQNHIFSKGIIIFMTAFNVIGRFSFLITFSAHLIFTFVPTPEIITTIAGGIEMGRRLVWNLLRIQNQQIKNNFFFQIRTDYAKNEKKIMKELSEKNPEVLRTDNLSEQRSEQELNLLRDLIRQKVSKRSEIVKFCKENHKLLENIEDDAEKQIQQILKK